MSIDNIIDQLKRDEGYRQFPYQDSRGVETIGYGFNLRDRGLSMEESTGVLRLRAVNVAVQLSGALPWTDRLDPIRRAVLVNMAYNMGLPGLLQFHEALQAVQRGDYTAASLLMLHSEWAAQVGDRAHRLSMQMVTGEWQ